MSGSYPGDERSQGSRIWGGRFRHAPVRNESTVCLSREQLDGVFRSPHGAYDAKKLFIAKYAAIRRRLEHFAGSRGVLVLAFDAKQEPVAEGWVKASRRKPRALIVGRHSQCPVRVDPDAMQIALRHLALIVRLTGSGLRCRMLDLHTGTGFAEEQGRQLESVSFDGTAFFAMHGLALLVLETGRGLPPADPEAAYADLPVRRFVEDAEQIHDALLPERRARIDGETWIYSHAGPLALHHEHTGQGTTVGRLAWFDGQDVRAQSLGHSALARGVLFGRSSKCSLRLGEHVGDLSRVHLLFIEEGGHVLAIDTASTNGTFVGSRQVSVVSLEPGLMLDVCDLRLAWEWAQ